MGTESNGHGLCRGAYRRVAVVLLVWAGIAFCAAAENKAPAGPVTGNRIKESGMLQMTPLTKGTYRFKGNVGERVQNNLDQWLLTAPYANPKMLEMFRLRDRQPRDNQVDWAGEFVGKYLISAVQATRMTDSPKLKETIRYVVSQLIACQDKDGYIGPWPQDQRLAAHWDLWGHYHVILGLVMWYEDTGDEAAYACALRAADFVCDTFLGEGKKTPADAGWSLTNLGIVHVFGRLYRYTGNERYLEFMRLIERDWARGDCGDPVNKGADTPYYRLNYKGPQWQGPARWESLHQLQGMIELYRITGDRKYTKAYENLWHSIRDLDVHNTGAFSTNESALGTPYTRGAIETCCHVAWQYMTEDMIALSGDVRAADEMERGFWNATLGYQHPSGRWSTYNTPCDGIREASAHTIVFQARNGSPELNCCSVNAPRGLGMLSEWALMQDKDGALVVNYYGPMEAKVTLANGEIATVTQETEYPASGAIRLTVSGTDAPIKVRIPGWTSRATVTVDGKAVGGIKPGTYASVGGKGTRVIALEFDMTVRTWLGAEDYADCVSIYYGPLLLTFDQKYNPYDCAELEPFDFASIKAERLAPAKPGDGPYPPLVLFSLATANGKTATLCDFASASVYGTNYRSWLPATNTPPGIVRLKQPEEGAAVPAGTALFTWTGKREATDVTYHLVVAEDEKMKHVVLDKDGLTTSRFLAGNFAKAGKTYYWTVSARNPRGTAGTLHGASHFKVDSALANPLNNPAMLGARADGLIAGDMLDGKPAPAYGAVLEARNVHPAHDRFGNEGKAIRFNGDGMLRFGFSEWPEKAMTVTFWAKPDRTQRPGNVQLFSAWCRGLDDPLRVQWDGQNKACGFSVEAHGTTFGSRCGTVEPETWFHVAVVRDGDTMRTYLNGVRTSEIKRPSQAGDTFADDFALGANPHFDGGEFFTGCLDEFAFYNKALSDEQIAKIAKDGLVLNAK